MRKRINVGLLVSNLVDPFDRAVYNGAQLGAKEEDVNLITFPGRYLKPQYNDTVRSRCSYQYNTIFSHVSKTHIDVLLVLLGTIGTVITTEEKRAFMEMFDGIPTLLIADTLEGYPSIGFDNRSGLKAGIREMIEKKGCRHIGMVSGPKTSEDARERLAVFRETMREHGMEVPEESIVYGNFSEFSDVVVRELLDRNKDLDGVVFANDQMAIGGYQVFKERKIVVGEDLMVMGFDDSPVAGRMAPGLTTVRADASELGRRAVKEAVKMAAGEKCEVGSVETRLVRRGSTGSEGYMIMELDEYRNFEEQWGIGTNAAVETILHKVMGDRYDFLMANEYAEELHEFVAIFLEIMRGARDDVGIERCVFLLGVIGDAMILQGDDIRYIFRLLDLLQHILHKKVSGPRGGELAHFLYDCLMQLGMLVSGATTKREAESFNFQWVSNSITRDMLVYGDNNDESYVTVNRKLQELGFTANYLYVLDQPFVNTEAGICSDWSVPEKIYLKSYFDSPETIHRIPRKKQLMDATAMYDNQYMREDRRYSLLISILFINEEQLGFYVSEVPRQCTRYVPMISDQISVAMKLLYTMDTQREIRRQLENSNEFLETISKIDELTGIYNRRGFRETAEHLVHNPIYRGKKAILVFADLDNLKDINDRLGHDDGDYALKAVAHILKESMRTADIVARIGGDEFVVLALVNKATEGEQLVERVKEYTIRFNESCEKDYYIGVSVGYSEFFCDGVIDLEHYMEQADEKLYEDKKKKRTDVMKTPEELRKRQKE